MISHDYKCIFIHIPRTGGTSIEKLLFPYPRSEKDLWMGLTAPHHNKYQTGGLQHLFAKHIRMEKGEDIFNSYFKFAFVRNPWDKAVSQYNYMKERKGLRDFLDMDENTPFKKYLELIAKKNHVQWEKQYKFIFDEDSKPMVDYLGKYESFTEDLNYILGRLRIITDHIPHVNKTQKVPYYEVYDRESKQMVEALYSEDIKLFEYSFMPNKNTVNKVPGKTASG